ncbi:hypothetical protein [Amycolatopsis sp. lyj-346]|uniref:hypothetical protein n=1 Tax=Amycolatopsis sp. lyj-346 TaxID=2789289 RepID=UPI00397AD001
MTNESLSYASVSTTLRPPRVVIVVDGGEQWSYWVRRAMFRADKVWGGAGFAVVPQRDGKVDPVLLRGCEAYDPDFVVTYHPTIADEHFQPGFIEVPADVEREQFLSMVVDDDVPSDADDRARRQIVAACSTYRSLRAGEWRENVEYLGEGPDAHFVDVLGMANTLQGSLIACPAQWGGTLGAAIAGVAGVAESPARDAVTPDLADEDRGKLGAWLLGARNLASEELVWHPGAAVGVDASETPTAHDRSKTGLVEISTGFDINRTGLLVVGDSVEDFALARLWRTTFGNGFWLPSDLLGEAVITTWWIAQQVSRIARNLAQYSNRLAITSMSRSMEDVAAVGDQLMSAYSFKVPKAADLSAMTREDLPWRQVQKVGLAVQDQWENRLTVPVSVTDDGTRRMAAPLPAPVLKDADLAAHPDLQYQVDVTWDDGRAPRRRGMDSAELFAERPRFQPTWARSSRFGITLQSRRNDLVMAGTRPENTLARVALRDMSLAAWIETKAIEHNLAARPSEAGLRAALLASMLGGRDRYVDLFGGALLPALRAMFPSSPKSKEAYPDGGGVSLSSREGVLDFGGIRGRAVGLGESDVRDRLDAALRAGVIRRGMVIQCSTCEQKQFQTIDRLGQRWSCVRCDAVNDLDQRAWKYPVDEPKWFYDLHPVARQVLSEHGEVPALLSARLRSEVQDGPIDDAVEVVFLKNNQRQVEVDLVAYADDFVTVAECKTPGELVGKAGRREVTKKCRAAAWLRADRLLFATTAEEWTSATKDMVGEEVRSFDGWGVLGPPDIEFVAGLGPHA